ncbi:MAG: ion transporter [Akkermansiaceae bacterium]
MTEEEKESLREAPLADVSMRERVWQVIFLSNTRIAQIFDITLLILIGASVCVVMLESVASVRAGHAKLFFYLEWIFTLVFTAEYCLRLAVVRNRKKYAFSFFGIVDLLSILPTYLALFFVGTQYLMVIRILRLLRMFRVLKMAHHFGQANVLVSALRSSGPKISVFLFFMLILVSIEGTLMYLIEGGTNSGFSSIPQSVYWAIVTVTTVGYGDVAPLTIMGKVLASFIMLSGFAIIAVPAGIMTSEIGMGYYRSLRMDARTCRECGWKGHDPSAKYCKHCGNTLSVES